jgi:hypothetical protein
VANVYYNGLLIPEDEWDFDLKRPKSKEKFDEIDILVEVQEEPTKE